MNIKSNEPLFYPYSILVNEGMCNKINDAYTKLYVPDTVKSRGIKVFNLMSITNEARHAGCYETYMCKYQLNASVYNNKQRWNNDKCRCECKELIDKGTCAKGFIGNPSNDECECDKSCT